MKLNSVENQYRLVTKQFSRPELMNRKFKLLEVGAGSRGLENHLPKNVSYKSLDFGKEHDYNFNLDDGKFPIKNGVYDVVVCTETLEHVMYPERVIKEMKRVAKSNALFFFSLPNDYNFMMRIYYLFGKKTLVDEPFQVVEKHLHIHKPRVEDIINLFSKYFIITEVDYVWQSRHSMGKFGLSFLFRAVDKVINFLAKYSPSLFARLVSVKARNRR